jgi:hypothetical protein
MRVGVREAMRAWLLQQQVPRMQTRTCHVAEQPHARQECPHGRLLAAAAAVWRMCRVLLLPPLLRVLVS